MDVTLIVTILIVIFALTFDFINGFHDTANSIATSVSTKALKPRQAVFTCGRHELCWRHDFYRRGANDHERYCRPVYIEQMVPLSFWRRLLLPLHGI